MVYYAPPTLLKILFPLGSSGLDVVATCVLSDRFITTGMSAVSLLMTKSLLVCELSSICIATCGTSASSSWNGSAVPWAATKNLSNVTFYVTLLYRSIKQVFSSTMVTVYGPVEIGASL